MTKRIFSRDRRDHTLDTPAVPPWEAIPEKPVKDRSVRKPFSPERKRHRRIAAHERGEHVGKRVKGCPLCRPSA
jgi:hypothetical protein